MENDNFIIAEIEKRMEGAVSNLKHVLNGLRTGRASASLLDPIKVEVYGDFMPINQLSTISVPESRLITVQVWDKSQVKNIEKAIMSSGLGLNPTSDRQLIRVPVPDLTEERRRELTKKAAEYGENAKIAIRNIRRDALDVLKKNEKDKEISEDELKSQSDLVQKITDRYIKHVDEAIKQKSAEIMGV